MPGTQKTQHITPSNASAALVNLQLRAVALCNEGANSRADIILTKRKENASMPKTYEELLAALQPDDANLLKNHIASITAEHEKMVGTLNTELLKAQNRVAELEKKAPADPPAATDPQQELLKSLSPELRALFEKQQSTINGLVEDRANALAAARFEKCKAIPAEEAELKEALKSASPAVVAILEKAAAAIEKTTHTAEGTDGNPQFVGSSADECYKKLEKSAKDLMAANAGMTYEAAFTKACELDPETYVKYTEGV